MPSQAEQLRTYLLRRAETNEKTALHELKENNACTAAWFGGRAEGFADAARNVTDYFKEPHDA